MTRPEAACQAHQPPQELDLPVEPAPKPRPQMIVVAPGRGGWRVIVDGWKTEMAAADWAASVCRALRAEGRLAEVRIHRGGTGRIRASESHGANPRESV